MTRSNGSQAVIERFHKLYPKTRHYLNFSNTLELLVATILSAQARDEMVNTVTPALFAKYKTASDYANAPLEELEKAISRLTFFRNKSKSIQGACRILADQYQGKVPPDMNKLVELPGIGRKTANAILTNGFDILAGITVDTHVIRVSYRLGLTRNKNPEKIEQDLMKVVPEKYWKHYPRWMKELGRAVCRAPKPVCSQCPMTHLCPKQGVAAHG